MTVCLLLPSSFEAAGTLQYAMNSAVNTGALNVPIAWPNYGNSDWELEAGREMLDQAFADWAGNDIVVLGHTDGSRVINLWLKVYGQTRFDDHTVDATRTNFYLLGDPVNRYGGVYFSEDKVCPKDTPYQVHIITRQYDGYADWPGDDTNNAAVTNSIYGQQYVNPDYYGINPDPTADGNYMFVEQNIKYIYSQTYPMPSIDPQNTLLKQWGLANTPSSGDWLSLEDEQLRPPIDAAYAVSGKNPRPVVIPLPAY